MKKNIILTGFMGSGKTSVGKLLAESMGYKFIDTDSVIVEIEKKPITDIFANQGEEYFRKVETRAIEIALANECAVIATGGGSVTIEENRKLFREKGIIINLKCSIEVVFKRLENTSGRPLFASKSVKEIGELMSQRERFYADNDYCIDVSLLTPIDIVKQIMVYYEKHNKKEQKECQ